MWPLLLAIATAALCLGLLEVPLDLRGASKLIRPFHCYGTVVTVAAVVILFWFMLRRSKWLRQRGAFVLSAIFLTCLITAWWFTLPLGDALAIHYQRTHPAEFDVSEIGYGWFYLDDSGMGANAMHILYLVLAVREPWWPILFFSFYPCFFHLYRRSQPD